MNIFKTALLFTALSVFLTVKATEDTLKGAEFNLLPVPQTVISKGSIIPIDSVNCPPTESIARLANIAGLNISNGSPYALNLSYVDSVPHCPPKNLEAYMLRVDSAGIHVEATTEAGMFWAMRTLHQLNMNTPYGLPEITIYDYPAFPLRGFTVDTGRTYISLEELKRQIEAMSMVKMNMFHWHLTENQAWRLESTLYPQLNHSVSMTRCPGKFYTKQECKELVDYADSLNVTVIPEIDMPGHSAAFKRTFGFDMQSPQGKEVAGNLLAEACATFHKAPIFHIGTDEVEFTDPDFAPSMARIVRNNGKKVMVWNPGWEYLPGEIDYVQMWSYRGKPLPGAAAVDSRLHYINHFDTYADIRALYRSRIYNREQADSVVQGTFLALWNDRYVDNEESLITQNSVYPLLLATAERAWLGGGTEYFDSSGTNFAPPGTDDYALFADFERRMLHHKATTLSHVPFPYLGQAHISWRITDPFPNNGDLDRVFPPETEGIKPLYTFNEERYRTREAYGAGIYLRHVWGPNIPSFYADPQPNHTAYAYTQVYSPIDQTAGLQFETQNYSRSEPDIAPPQDQWDFRHSKLWINGREIAPPFWEGDTTEKSNENPLRNENMTARKPLPVHLAEGWNRVMIKLPVGEFSTPETRLVKWMFSFILTTPDGSEALPGIVYSPDANCP